MKNLFGRVIGSVAVKIVVIMLALGGTTAAAILVASSLISGITDEVENLVNENVPPLETASRIANSVAILKDKTNIVIESESLLGLPAQAENLKQAAADLKSAASSLGVQKHPNLRSNIDKLSVDIDTLVQQRTLQLTSAARTRHLLIELNRISHDVSNDLETLNDEAAFRLLLAGNDAMSSAKTTVDELIKTDLGSVTASYALKAQSDYATGLSLALIATKDSTQDADIKNRNQDALDTFEKMIEQTLQTQELAQIRAELSSYRLLLSSLNTMTPFDRQQARQSILDTHSKLTTSFSDLFLQEQNALTAKGDSAALANELVIKSLLDERITEIRSIDALNTSLKAASIKLLQGATSVNKGYIEALQFELNSDRAVIEAKLEIIPEETAGKILTILKSVDPQNGLLDTRRTGLEAQMQSHDTTLNMISALLELSNEILTISNESFDAISRAGEIVTSDARAASTTMKSIGLIAILILIAAPLMTFLTIMRPLSIVTQSTEQLANGDMSELKKAGGKYGEIAQLMAALRVFRNNLLEKEAMEVEAVERAKKARQEEIELETQRKEREAAEQERERQTAAREQEREAAAELEKQKSRDAAEKDRAARHKEQTEIVDALAEGLRRLALGDISKTIDKEFPEGYEQLRNDFNAAVKSLEEVVSKLSDTSQAIHSSSSEISHAADDLSVRTERTASTLAESAAALTQLTVSVQSAADGASLANQTVMTARTNAESTNLVVKDAISAMDAISESSSKISKIISVIDDIAFQTNLLALNAGVEAARAGEAGRGFAVVASEVRALAQRSSEAAHEINQLISDSGSEVKRGVSLVDQTGEALKSIVGDVSKIANHMSEIETSAKEQSAGISEINLSVADLDQATQQNAAMFEETTAASHSLTQEASALKSIVSQFVTSHTDENQVRTPTSVGGDSDMELAS